MAEGIRVVLDVDDNLTLAIRNAQSEVRKFVSASAQAAASAKSLEKSTTSLGSKFRDLVLVGGMLRFIAYDIRDIFNATAGATIKASSEIQRMTKVMEGLSNATDEQARKQEALSNREFIFKLSKNAPFEVNALTDSFIKFKSAGLDPTNGSMQALVDSVASYGGSSEQLKRASIAIQQMAGKGVVSMEELRQQLGEAVPSAMALMAQGMGMNMAELAKAVKTGTVEATNAIDRMTYQMKLANAGAAEAMMQTWQGQFEKLKTNMSLFLNDIGTMGAEAGADGDPAKDSFMGRLSQGLMEFNKYLESSEGKKLAADLAIIMSDLAKAMVTAAQAAGKAARFIIENWDRVVQVIGTLTTLFVAEKFYSQLKKMGTGLSEFINDIRAKMAAKKAIELQAMQDALRAQILVRESEINNLAIQKAAMEKQAQDLSALRAKQTAEHARQLEIEKRNMDLYYANIDKTTRGLYLKRAQNARIARSDINKSLSEIERQEGVLANAIATNNINSANSKNKLLAATRGLSAGLTGLGAAVSFVSRGLSALLGPIGLVMTAVSLGATAWELWGRNATQSLDDAIRKTKEYATVDNLEILRKQKGVTQQGANELSASVSAYEKNPNGDAAVRLRRSLRSNTDVTSLELLGMSDEELVKKAKEKLAYMGEQIKKAGVAETNGTKQVFERAVEENVNSYNQALDKILGQYDSAFTRAQRARKEAMPNEKVTDFNEWQRQARGSFVRAQLDFVSSEEKRINAKLATAKEGTVKYKELLGEKTALAERALRLNAEIEDQVNKIGNQVFNAINDPGKGVKTGAEKTDKLEKYLNDAQDKILRIKESFADVKYGIDEFKQELERGDYDLVTMKKGKEVSRVRGVNRPEVQEILTLKTEAEKLRQKYEAQKDIIKEFDSVYEQLQNKGADVGERFSAAVSNFVSNSKAITTEVAKFDADANRFLDGAKKALEAKREQARLAYEAAPDSEKFAKSLLIPNDEQINAQLIALANYLSAVRQQMVGISALSIADKFRDEASALEAQNNPDKRAVAAQQLNVRIQQVEQEFSARLEAAKGYNEELVKLEIEKDRLISALRENYRLESRTSFQVMLDDWKNTTLQMSTAMESWANGAIDVMVNFVKTGKLEFGDLVDSILTDILRMQMKAAAANLYGAIFGGQNGGYEPLPAFVPNMTDGGGGFFDDIISSVKGFFSFANGGIMTSSGAVELRKYAMGGIANSPQLALYGEGSMNEAFVPLPDGRTIPVTMTGGRAQTNVIVNVVNAPENTTVQQSQGQDGSTNIDIIIGQVEGKISQNLAKGRGALSTVMEKTYGLNRVAGAY